MAKKVLLPVGQHTMEVTVKGSNYNVRIDGNEFCNYKHGSISYWFGAEEDFPMEIDGVQYILSVRKNKIRLVSNGVYIDNGQPFVPARPMPKWIWVFAILLILIPIVSVGGAINILIALGGISLCALVARSAIKSGALKVLLCVLVTVTFYAIWFLFIGSMLLLQYGL